MLPQLNQITTQAGLRSFLPILLATLLFVVGAPSVGRAIDPAELEDLMAFKANLYKGLTAGQAAQVQAGTAEALLHLRNGENLPTLWLHFRVLDDQVTALAAELPPGLSLAEVSIRERERPRYYLTVAVSEEAGDRNGIRAEWRTYVTSASDPYPKTLILEAQTSQGELNPVDLQAAPADLVSYTVTNGRVLARIIAGTSSFSAQFDLPRRPRRWRVDPGWNATWDQVYWKNGVADRFYYRGLVSNRKLNLVRGRSARIFDETRWAAFVDPRPRWVLLLDERLDYAMLPWVNVTDPALDLDPVFRDTLISTKASEFGALLAQRAQDIGNRLAEPLALFGVEPTPPSIFIVFNIPPSRRQALADAIPLPDGFELARMRTVRGTGRRHILALNIYEATGLAPGFRAEWSVYVTKGADPVPYYMVVEAQHSGLSVDPVTPGYFKGPADRFEYTLTNGVIEVDIEEGDSTFQATIPLPAQPRRTTSDLNWVEANNNIYWSNGVADWIYYNGLTYARDLIRLRAREVTINDGSRWAPFLEAYEVLVFENQLEFVASPWRNLDLLAEEISP